MQLHQLLLTFLEPGFRPSAFRPSAGLFTLLLLQILSILTAAQDAPTVSQFMAFDAVEGATIQLQCNVSNKGDNHLFWYFDPETGGDGHLIGEGDFADKYRRPRFTILYNADASSYNLQITNVMDSDAGLYTCTVTGSVLPASAGRLGVFPPSPPSSGPMCEIYNSLPLKDGEYINGTCRASPGGNTPSSLQWFDDRDISVTPKLRHNGDLSILRKASVRDNGARYTCRETHVALKEPRDCFTKHLHVVYAPRVNFLPVDKSAEIGSNATLTCRTTSNPSVQDAILFVNDSRVYLTSVNDTTMLSTVDSRFKLTRTSTDTGINLAFTIYGFKEEDYLLSILCQAWNEEGERNQTTMFVVPPPEGDDSNLLFILAIDLAALFGLVIIIACILVLQPICDTICGDWCRARRRKRKEKKRRWFDRREVETIT